MKDMTPTDGTVEKQDFEDWKRSRARIHASKLNSMLGKVEALISAARIELFDIWVKSSDDDDGQSDEGKDVKAYASILREFLRCRYPTGIAMPMAREIARVLIGRPMSETTMAAILEAPDKYRFAIRSLTGKGGKALVPTGAPSYEGLAIGEMLKREKRAR